MNREAADYLRQVRLGQTEQGSYVVTLLTPVIPPPMRQVGLFDSKTDDNAPIGRRITRHLIEALTAAQEAAERTSAGDAAAFSETVKRGASANLCDALATLIEPFGGIDIGLTWARTWPEKTVRETFCFGPSDAPILREAAQRFRASEPKLDVFLVGRIQRLERDDAETDGTVTLRTYVDERVVSIRVDLDQYDYDRAIQAHRNNSPVVMKGDLERFRNRWHLRDPYIADVISDEDDEDGNSQALDL